MTKIFLFPGSLICDAVGLTEDSGSRQILRVFLNMLIWGAVGVTIVLAIAFATPSPAFAGPMNFADPVLVPAQASTTIWHDYTTTWQSGRFQKHHVTTLIPAKQTRR
jgi:hypothetical protein